MGSLPERIIDGVTGTLTNGDAEFASAAIALLRDDELWRRAPAGAARAGDAVAPRTIYEAVLEGRRAALAIVGGPA